MSEEYRKRLREKLGSIKLDSNKIQMITPIINTDPWTAPLGQSLLSGKFIGQIAGKYVQSEFTFNSLDCNH